MGVGKARDYGELERRGEGKGRGWFENWFETFCGFENWFVDAP